MPIINVEVPDFIAKKFVSYKVVKSEVLYEELKNNDVFIDFGIDGIGKKDFEEYFIINKDKKEFIKTKLQNISLKYSKKGILSKNISDIDKLIYLK